MTENNVSSKEQMNHNIEKAKRIMKNKKAVSILAFSCLLLGIIMGFIASPLSEYSQEIADTFSMWSQLMVTVFFFLMMYTLIGFGDKKESSKKETPKTSDVIVEKEDIKIETKAITLKESETNTEEDSIEDNETEENIDENKNENVAIEENDKEDTIDENEEEDDGW